MICVFFFFFFIYVSYRLRTKRMSHSMLANTYLLMLTDESQRKRGNWCRNRKITYFITLLLGREAGMRERKREREGITNEETQSGFIRFRDLEKKFPVFDFTLWFCYQVGIYVLRTWYVEINKKRIKETVDCIVNFNLFVSR